MHNESLNASFQNHPGLTLVEVPLGTEEPSAEHKHVAHMVGEAVVVDKGPSLAELGAVLARSGPTCSPALVLSCPTTSSPTYY